MILLARGALVLAEAWVGAWGARSPGELGDPHRRDCIAVVRHRGAGVDDPLASLVQGAAVGVQGCDVEVVPDPGHAVEVAEEGPGLHVTFAEQPGEDDLGLLMLALDRVVGDPKQPAVPLGRRRRRPESLQVGLVPDLPRLDRQRRAAGVILLVVVGPVAAPGPVARHRRLGEVRPCLLVGGAVERGPGELPVAHPRRGSVEEGNGPDSARGEVADDLVVFAPVEGTALGWLHPRPEKQHAVRPDLCVPHPLEVLIVERGPVGDAEELRPDGTGGGRG